MTPDRVTEFVALVQDVRAVQRYYRRTMCPMARRELMPLEERLDRVADQVAGELAAESAAAAAEARPEWLITAEAARQEGGGQ